MESIADCSEQCLKALLNDEDLAQIDDSERSRMPVSHAVDVLSQLSILAGKYHVINYNGHKGSINLRTSLTNLNPTQLAVYWPTTKKYYTTINKSAIDAERLMDQMN